MTRAPRVLLFGMQSSGASFIAWLAAQGGDTLGVIDLWNPETAPRLDYDGPIVLKATVGPIDLNEHERTFKPSARVLVLRDPRDQISVLDDESFRDYALPLEDKLAAFNHQVAAGLDEFDLVLKYEEVVERPASAVDAFRALGLPMPSDATALPRSINDVVSHARATEPWCHVNWRKRWGTGRINTSVLPRQAVPVRRDAGAVRLAARHCPDVLDHYR